MARLLCPSAPWTYASSFPLLLFLLVFLLLLHLPVFHLLLLHGEGYEAGEEKKKARGGGERREGGGRESEVGG